MKVILIVCILFFMATFCLGNTITLTANGIARGSISAPFSMQIKDFRRTFTTTSTEAIDLCVWDQDFSNTHVCSEAFPNQHHVLVAGSPVVVMQSHRSSLRYSINGPGNAELSHSVAIVTKEDNLPTQYPLSTGFNAVRLERILYGSTASMAHGYNLMNLDEGKFSRGARVNITRENGLHEFTVWYEDSNGNAVNEVLPMDESMTSPDTLLLRRVSLRPLSVSVASIRSEFPSYWITILPDSSQPAGMEENLPQLISALAVTIGGLVLAAISIVLILVCIVLSPARSFAKRKSYIEGQEKVKDLKPYWADAPFAVWPPQVTVE